MSFLSLSVIEKHLPGCSMSRDIIENNELLSSTEILLDIVTGVLLVPVPVISGLEEMYTTAPEK